jgi:hypothetical protein
LERPVDFHSHRVILAKELRKAVAPVMKEWGFANPPKGSPDWYHATRPNTWVRTRDGFTDEIYIGWPRNGLRFYISMRTDQVERMRSPEDVGPVPRLADIDVLASRVQVFVDFMDFKGRLFGGLGPIEKSIRLALARLEEANRYLLTGVPSRHIALGGGGRRWGDDPEKDYPVFWWREGGADAYRKREAEGLLAAKKLRHRK